MKLYFPFSSSIKFFSNYLNRFPLCIASHVAYSFFFLTLNHSSSLAAPLCLSLFSLVVISFHLVFIISLSSENFYCIALSGFPPLGFNSPLLYLMPRELSDCFSCYPHHSSQVYLMLLVFFLPFLLFLFLPDSCFSSCSYFYFSFINFLLLFNLFVYFTIFFFHPL